MCWTSQSRGLIIFIQLTFLPVHSSRKFTCSWKLLLCGLCCLGSGSVPISHGCVSYLCTSHLTTCRNILWMTEEKRLPNKEEETQRTLSCSWCSEYLPPFLRKLEATPLQRVRLSDYMCSRQLCTQWLPAAGLPPSGSREYGTWESDTRPTAFLELGQESHRRQCLRLPPSVCLFICTNLFAVLPFSTCNC